MATIHRRGIPVEALTTLLDAGHALGGSKNLIDNHKRKNTKGFPRPVARFGPVELYVMSEIEAFYNSVVWRQADKSIRELTGEM